MKIRTDFVTNSSSVSYITVHVETKSGDHMQASFEGRDDINPRVHSGCIYFEQEEYEQGDTFESIVKQLAVWVYETLKYPECSNDDIDEIIQIYGYGDVDSIMKTKISDAKIIRIHSSLEYWDESFGTSEIEYDYLQKKLTEEHDEGML